VPTYQERLQLRLKTEELVKTTHDRTTTPSIKRLLYLLSLRFTDGILFCLNNRQRPPYLGFIMTSILDLTPELILSIIPFLQGTDIPARYSSRDRCMPILANFEEQRDSCYDDFNVMGQILTAAGRSGIKGKDVVPLGTSQPNCLENIGCCETVDVRGMETGRLGPLP
jgi:hypothetical protein